MKNFLDWVKDNKLELPMFTDADKGTNTLDERGLRTGIKFGYPDGYVRGHYPDAYPAASSATAYLDREQSKQQKDKAPPDNAP